jgi:hypothetical protein
MAPMRLNVASCVRNRARVAPFFSVHMRGHVMAQKELRDWTERNQGPMPQADPLSKHDTTGRDIAKPSEGQGPNGDVTGEPGASGSTGSGTHPGTGSLGGTGSPTGEGSEPEPEQRTP